jgi:hypothetical protein
MDDGTRRLIFVLAFAAACVAFRLGVRRFRRVRGGTGTLDAFRLAFHLSLALMVGCSGATNGTTGPRVEAGADGGTAAPAATTGLGAEADEVWAQLIAEWDGAAAYRPGQVSEATLNAARGRADALLARLGGITRVGADAPGLVTLLRIEFGARLEIWPADVTCYEPMPPTTAGADAWVRLEARVEALEELAEKGYLNPWLELEIYESLREAVAVVRAGAAAGDDWRTEDYRLRSEDPDRVADVLARADAALERLRPR